MLLILTLSLFIVQPQNIQPNYIPVNDNFAYSTSSINLFVATPNINSTWNLTYPFIYQIIPQIFIGINDFYMPLS
jgi:hypothetical protein